MKKIIFVLAVIMMGFLPGVKVWADEPTTEWSSNCDTNWGSDYSTANTFTISDADDLAQFAYLVNSGNEDFSGKTVTLAADLDLKDHKWTPIGYYVSSKIKYPFKGTFDGGGHNVSGMYINISSGNSACAGLFGCLEIGTVQNLSVSGSVSVTVEQNNEQALVYVGGVVGYNRGNSGDVVSKVTNCYYNGSISVTASTNSSAYVGGIVGYSQNNGIVTNCYHSGTGDISVTSPSTSYVGGIVGFSKNNGKVTNCYHSGTGSISVSGSISNAYAGGVVGTNENSTVTNC